MGRILVGATPEKPVLGTDHSRLTKSTIARSVDTTDSSNERFTGRSFDPVTTPLFSRQAAQKFILVKTSQRLFIERLCDVSS